jgi:PiT family inorganic phosphate transporter
VLTDADVSHSVGMVMALLLTAIIWNFGTWYYGIPCSSSHTLVGSILGVGLAFSFVAEKPGTYVNWAKAGDIGLSLLLSPLIGFSIAIFFMYMLRQVVKNRMIFKQPHTNNPPPFWIRGILLLTCTGVSLSHGSNDGQKGVGLVMLILIAIVPGYFAIDSSRDINEFKRNIIEVNGILSRVDPAAFNHSDSFEFAKVGKMVNAIDNRIRHKISFRVLEDEQQFALRRDLVLLGKASRKLLASEDLNLSKRDKDHLGRSVEELKGVTDYAPLWVIILVALSLGVGTMFGWKRIVKTIGEKIGKQHLTYAQGASSELVAAGTISLSTWLGLPVSTTQVLSSGVAGSMVASKGIKNLQGKTIRNIALAWVLTLPVCILLSGAFFLIFRAIF